MTMANDTKFSGRSNTYPNEYHDDGTVTYWSVYQQQWVHHAALIPAKELAEMSADERDEAIAFLDPHA